MATEIDMNYEERIALRLFSNIRDEVRQIAKNAKDEHGIPKYESESHAIRSALMLFIKVEGEKMRGVNNGARGNKGIRANN